MCIYCSKSDDVKSILDTQTDLSSKGDFYPGTEIWIEKEEGTLNVISIADTYETGYSEESVKINFCPMCGEKL